MINVWCHFQKGNDTQRQKAIVTLLGKAGVNAVTYDANCSGGPGIVFLEEINRELCDFLRDASRNGRERVLAVALPGTPVHCDIWSLLQAGAADVISWEESGGQVRDIALRFERWSEADEVLESSLVSENLVGTSPVWRKVLRQIVEAARYTDASVLITGESGTGKELAARLIHTLDLREKKRDLVVVDCTTIVPSLSGSEFFGHERGAFTGAVAARDGAFALADDGTLFLDEVGELPLELQAQLLRVIQEKCYKRVGGNTWQRTEFRLICATNRDLQEEVRNGRFRHDLYYRIAGWECRLPPLRERSEDILPLTRHFMTHATRYETLPVLDRAVEDFLIRREYPGNVRDLKQLVARIMYRHVGKGAVTVGAIPPEERPHTDCGDDHWCNAAFEQAIRRAILLGVGLKEIGRNAEDAAVDIAVHTENGNLQRAALRLGVTDRALQLRRANRRQNGATA